MSEMALIELVSDDDHIVISSPDGGDLEGIFLGTSPDGMYSTGFKTRIVQGAFEVGGRSAGDSIPVREMVLPFVITGDGDGLEANLSRFRKMWRLGREIHWRYTTEESGMRSLWVRLAEEIKITTEFDRSVNDMVAAVVSAVALQPMYEGEEESVSWSNPSVGSHTGTLIVSNPTDQKCFLEYTMDPATSWAFPDFSFGQEDYYDRAVGVDAERMIVSPALTQRLSVMADKQYDTYVSADLSNAGGLFGVVKPQYWLPPYTPPTEVPVACNGPKDATITITMRRLWSSETGLE